jgi:hypothetical protein
MMHTRRHHVETSLLHLYVVQRPSLRHVQSHQNDGFAPSGREEKVSSQDSIFRTCLRLSILFGVVS